MISTENKAIRSVLTTIESAYEEIIEFLSTYFSFKSINPTLAINEETHIIECQDWIANLIDKSGAFVKVDYWEAHPGAPNVVGLIKGRGKGRSLMFNGHTDVVPVTPEQEKEWLNSSPWKMQIKNGMAYARGASDMKGGNAAFLLAAMLLRRAGVQLAGDLSVTTVSLEESGDYKNGCVEILNKGYRADLCIVPEATDMQIIPSIMGEFYFKLIVHGRSGHWANRSEFIYPREISSDTRGVNAIEKMYNYIDALQKLERSWGLHYSHPLLPPGSSTINPSLISGGEAFSALAQQCTLTAGVLVYPGTDTTEIQKEIKRVIKSVAASDLWLQEHPPSLEMPYLLDAKEPVNLPIDHPGCRDLAWAFKQATQRKPIIIGSSNTSDANFLAMNGQPCIMFGPGALRRGVHGKDEHVPISEIIDSIKTFALMAIHWCGIEDVIPN